jgi:ankyrin repeat protein
MSESSIHKACESNDIISLVLLLDAGANPNTMNSQGIMPLQIAKMNGFIAAYDIILSYGGVIGAKNPI